MIPEVSKNCVPSYSNVSICIFNVLELKKKSHLKTFLLTKLVINPSKPIICSLVVALPAPILHLQTAVASAAKSGREAITKPTADTTQLVQTQAHFDLVYSMKLLSLGERAADMCWLQTVGFLSLFLYQWHSVLDTRTDCLALTFKWT